MRRTEWFATGLMVAAAALAPLLEPEAGAPARAAAVDLETLVPAEFGDWRIEPETIDFVMPRSLGRRGVGAEQVLNRTYVNADYEKILLTVAYGSDQSDTLRLHRPEVCYAAQGFAVSAVEPHAFPLGGKRFEVRRLTARSGLRHEPITYWTVVGSRVVTGRVQRKLEQLRYALAGDVPDGILVRVSSLDRDPEVAFARHEAFIRDLLGALGPEATARMAGEAVM